MIIDQYSVFQILKILNNLRNVILVFNQLNLSARLQLKGNLKKLYQLIQKESTFDDHDVMAHLFPSSQKENARKHLWQLKSNLTDHLISMMLSVDLDDRWSAFQKGYFKSWKRYAIARILLGLGLRQSAIAIAEKSIKASLQHHFTELSLNFSRILRDHYAKYAEDRKKYLHYKQLSTQYFDLLYQEDLLEDLYNELILYFPMKSSVEQIQAVKKYPAIVDPILKEYDYFRIHFLGYNIKVLSYQMGGEYESVIEACDAAINSLQRFPAYSGPAFLFRLRKIPNLLQLKAFQKAEKTIDDCLNLTGSSTHNWLATQHYNALLGLHTENWDHVLTVFAEVSGQQKALPEIWYVYEAYAHILKGNTDFRLGKFLNQVNTLAKDKQGMNINVRIIEVLYHLLHQELGKLIDKQDALREYSKRHLRKDQSTYRSDLFIRLLLLLPRYSFRSIGIEKAALPYLKKLKGNPLDMVLQDTDLEVVPFERLWEWVREHLS